VPGRIAFRTRFLLWIVTGLFLCQSTALLTGSVTDSWGATATGAQGKCLNTDTDLAISAVGNNQGLTRLPDLPAGLYEVPVSHQGSEPLVRSNIRTYTEETLDLNLTPALGSVETLGPTFGQITDTRDPRPMQVALKLRFYGA
jgi:hypothetical protein